MNKFERQSQARRVWHNGSSNENVSITEEDAWRVAELMTNKKWKNAQGQSGRGATVHIEDNNCYLTGSATAVRVWLGVINDKVKESSK
ncbi:MAG: hypothetical protein V1858_00265 [Candidatus Gottesmanbacteria bacterium]